MSATPKETKPDFDEEFLQTLSQWKEKNKIRDDDAVYLLVELFRIHQKHWDALRQRQMPSLDQFRTDITAVTESSKSFREKLEELIEVLAAQPARCRLKLFPCRRRFTRRHRVARRSAHRFDSWKIPVMKINFIPLHWHKLPALPKPVWAIVAGYGIFLIIIAVWHLFASHKPKKYVAKLGNLTWRRNQFCRGWLITGDTGSGKTSSGHQSTRPSGLPE
jgi:hypothetical protein